MREKETIRPTQPDLVDRVDREDQEEPGAGRNPKTAADRPDREIVAAVGGGVAVEDDADPAACSGNWHAKTFKPK